MDKTPRHITAALILLATLCSTVSLRADYPPYLLLRTPTAPTPHKPTHGYYPGQAYPVETQAFSYGWFGAPPRSHATRHFGYNRNYTQWSWK